MVVDENFLYLILLKFLSELDLRIKLLAVIKRFVQILDAWLYP